MGGVVGGLALVSLVGLAVLFLQRYQASVLRGQSSQRASARIYKGCGDTYDRHRKSIVPKNPWNDPGGPVELSSYPVGSFHN